MNSLMKPIDVHRIRIEELSQDDSDYGIELLTNLYSKQEIADRLEELFNTKHEIEYKMKSQSLTSYEARKFTTTVEELQQILSILLREFKEEL